MVKYKVYELFVTSFLYIFTLNTVVLKNNLLEMIKPVLIQSGYSGGEKFGKRCSRLPIDTRHMYN